MLIQGSSGTPNGHIGVQVFIFIKFRVPVGSPLGSFWRHVCDLYLVRGAKVGDAFQVHVFGDPGTEMMPECWFCLCYNISKS